MTNLYVMQDRVSGAFGAVFESPNDETVKRDFINLASNAAIPEYAIRDTLVIHLGSFDQDEKNPSIQSVGIPRVILRGFDHEVCKARERAVSADAPDTV